MSEPKEIEFFPVPNDPNDPKVIFLPLKSQELWIEYTHARLTYLTHKKKLQKGSSYNFIMTLAKLAEHAESKETAWLEHVIQQRSG